MSLADGDVRNWDPIVPTDNMAIWTMLHIYDQMVRVAPDGRSVEPALAESFTVSDDGTTYTFTMRGGVQFHDGTPLRIEDLQYAVTRGLSDESSWNALVPPISRMETPDKRTLVIELSEPWAPFLADLALFAFSIIPKQQHEQRGTAFFDQPIGTGPFMLDRWERGSKVLLKRHPNFWDSRYPYLDSVELQVLPDDNSRMLKFAGGELDVVTNVPSNQIAALQSDPKVVVQITPIMSLHLLSLNHARAPFAGHQIRRAINLAIDRDALVKSVLFGHGSVANSILPQTLYWSDKLATYLFDLAQAKELLSRSSHPQGFDATLMISAGDMLQRSTATIIQNQLKQLGINITIEERDSAALFESATSGSFDLLMVGLTSDIIDPDELAKIVFAPSGGLNAIFTGYKNNELDTLIRQAAHTIEPAVRARQYEQMQRMYHDDAVVVPLLYAHSRTATHADVQGFRVLPTANYRLWEVWLTE